MSWQDRLSDLKDDCEELEESKNREITELESKLERMTERRDALYNTLWEIEQIQVSTFTGFGNLGEAQRAAKEARDEDDK